MYCTQCGTHLPETAKFCSRCGSPTIQNTDQSSQSGKSSKAPARELADIGEKKEKFDKKAPPRIPLLSIFLAVIGLILIIVLLNPWHKAEAPPADFNPTGGDQNAVQPVFNAQVMQIAEKFMCPCGECNDVLSECDCTMPNGAQEAKTFIMNALQAGKSTQQVIQATALKYGHMRQESS